MLKKLFVSTLLFIFAVNSLSVFAQVSKRPAPKTTAPVSKFDQNQTEQIKPDDSANDFATSGLPSPQDFGGAPNDELAAALAKEITNYEKDGLPLLITTLQRAGFFIINENQKILYQPTSGQGMGLAFYDSEVAGMYKLSRRGIVSSLDRFTAQLGKQTPDLPPSKIANLMMQDLKLSANSSNKLVRFWARLIVEIGKNSPQPVDLLNTNSTKIPLNIIQISLWERRLIGDLIAFAEEQTANLRPIPVRTNKFEFVNASFFKMAPCQLNDAQGVALDISSIGITTGHGKVLEAIAEGSSETVKARLGNVATGLAYVNIVLSWVKLVAALMTVKGEIKIAEPMPLERFKGIEGGDSRLMTAKVWTEIGNKAYLNCLRPLVNTATGLDFGMPNEGPLEERDIAWELTDAASFSGQKSGKTGKFDNFVQLKAPNGGNPLQQITDKGTGESRMNMLGGTRNATLINKPVVPIRKKASVKIAVSFKSSRDFVQNWIDIGGATIGAATGGPLSILASLPEIGFRLKWDVYKLNVPVKDWELCTSDWAGTVKYTRIFKSSVLVNTGARKGTRTIDEKTEIEWTLNPRKRDMPADTPPIPDDVSVKVDNSDIFEGTGEADVCCDKKEAKDSKARIREAITLKVDNETKSILKIDLSEGNFLLSIYPFISDTNVFKGIQRRSFTVSESACPVDEDQTAESTKEAFAERSLEALRQTKTNRTLSNNGESVEELSGTEKFDDPRGGEITYFWSLARCGDL